jgi:isoamylase
MSTHAIQHQGKSFPLGSTLVPGGANFSVFAKYSTGAQLLFDDIDVPNPSRVIDLDPRSNRTYHYWHAFVPGITAGQIYAYRVSGPFDPVRGLRFDPNKVLLDPYGKCIARPAGRSREAARHRGDNAASALRNVVVDPSAFDWGVMRLSGGLLPKRSSMRCMSAGSPAIRAPASASKGGEPTPG